MTNYEYYKQQNPKITFGELNKIWLSVFHSGMCPLDFNEWLDAERKIEPKFKVGDLIAGYCESQIHGVLAKITQVNTEDEMYRIAKFDFIQTKFFDTKLNWNIAKIDTAFVKVGVVDDVKLTVVEPQYSVEVCVKKVVDEDGYNKGQNTIMKAIYLYMRDIMKIAPENLKYLHVDNDLTNAIETPTAIKEWLTNYRRKGLDKFFVDRAIKGKPTRDESLFDDIPNDYEYATLIIADRLYRSYWLNATINIKFDTNLYCACQVLDLLGLQDPDTWYWRLLFVTKDGDDMEIDAPENMVGNYIDPGQIHLDINSFYYNKR